MFTFTVIAAEGRKRDSIYNHMVAINISQPLLRMIAKSTPDTTDSYVAAPLFQIGHQHKKYVTRFGLSGSSYTTESSNDLTQDLKTSINNRFRIISSLYRVQTLSSKIRVQYGLNVSGQINLNDQISDSGFDKVNLYSRSYGVGVGPGILFQYQILPRLTLHTEYITLYQYIHSDIGKRFSAFPSENYSNKANKSLGMQFDYPISLYLQYHF